MNNSSLVLDQARNIRDEIIKVRRWLHAHPELGFEEYKTSEFIVNYLKQLGLEIKTNIAKTGVVAFLKGGLPGNTIALRADIDALPIQEGYESEFKSRFNGRMHACGHDAHTAILLGAANLLVKNREKLKGSVKFIFQPAEEYVSGAKPMIDDGVLQNPDVNAILALHIIPDIENGMIEVKKGVIMASMDEFKINIIGIGGHGSTPQNTIDPIITGAQVLVALQTIVSRKICPIQPAVVSVCQFIAGTKSNTIPQSAYLSGTIRCHDLSVRKTIFEQLEQITKGVCLMMGAEYELTINEQVPVTVNDSNVFDDFVNCSSDILEKDEIILMDKPRTYSEDFALYGQKVPSLYFFLGTKNQQKDCVHPLHSPNFKIDESVLSLGSALFANYCLNRHL